MCLFINQLDANLAALLIIFMYHLCDSNYSNFEIQIVRSSYTVFLLLNYPILSILVPYTQLRHEDIICVTMNVFSILHQFGSFLFFS